MRIGPRAPAQTADITSLTRCRLRFPVARRDRQHNRRLAYGTLITTPETIINVADYGGCSGVSGSDNVNVNAAFSAARSSAAYSSNQPVRIVGGFSSSNVACAVTQINATGFNRFGAGSRLIIEDLTLLCAPVQETFVWIL